MKKGQAVAAYVRYVGEDENWIIGKIERKIGAGKFIVRDEFSEDHKYDRYVVKSRNMTLFPHVGGQYEVGEHVIASWKDIETKEWSTMLYDAEVVRINRGNTISLKYMESNNVIDVSTSKITKYPPKFYEEQDEEEENKEISNDNSTKSENGTPIKQESSSVTPKELTENDSDTQKAPPPTPQNSSPVTEDRSVTSPAVPSSPPASPPLVDESVSAHRFSPETIDDSFNRRIVFTFHAPENVEKSDMKLLSDDDFDKFVGNTPSYKRMAIENTTPLIDALQDPMLFDSRSSHFTGNGTIFRKGLKHRHFRSAYMNDYEGGRIGKIFGEWKKINHERNV